MYFTGWIIRHCPKSVFSTRGLSPSDKSHVSKSMLLSSLPAHYFSSSVFTKVPSCVRLLDGIAPTGRKFRYSWDVLKK